MTTAQLGQFLDPGALALIGLGCLLVAAIQNGLGGLGTALAAAGRLVRSAGERERARLAAIMLEDLVQRRGVSCADREVGACAFTHQLGTMMSDEPGFESYAKAVDGLLQACAARRARAIQVWNDLADAAPALGMLGTVLGLVQMFGAMDSAEGIGAAMALCLLTSLYGLIFAHLVAGPIARRLEMIGEHEGAWQGETAQRMLKLARREYPDRAMRRTSPAAAKDEASRTHPDLVKALRR